MTEIIVSESHKFLLPDTWNELTYEQLTQISDDLFTYSLLTDERLQVRIKTKIALRLSGFTPVLKDNDFVALEIARKILPLIDFLFTRNLLTEQKVPSVLIRKKWLLQRFYGPAANFANLSFGEFDDAEFWFKELQNPANLQREQALNMLMAILYRPYFETKGDNRQAYSAHDNEPRSLWMACCPVNIKLIVLLWYMGCRNALVDDFKELFAASTGEGGSWTMLAHSLAGPTLGNIDKVNARPVRQVFYELLRLHLQAEQQQKQ